MAKIVGIIPARYGSTRFEGKALADLAGRPMIEHVYRRAEQSRLLERVLVATDDPRIKEAVEGFGGEAVLTRPDHPSGTDRVAEVAEGLEAELIVNIQGDEPLIEPEMIDQAIQPLADDDSIPMGTLMTRINNPRECEDPNVVKVVVDREGFALYFSRSPIPYPREGEPIRYQHIGLYVYRRDFLLRFAQLPPTPLEQIERLEQLRALEHGYRIKVVETEHGSIGVDTPEDLERVKAILEGKDGR